VISNTEKMYPAVLLLGPTGSGKTPLGEIIEKRGLCGTPCRHFDFGANLRDVVNRDRPDGQIGLEEIDFLKGVLQSGALLEDEHFPIARRILQSFISHNGVDGTTRIVLNGLPRHVGQAREIDQMLEVEQVIHLECTADIVLSRIRTNIGGDRADRDDDELQTVRGKLTIYRQRTEPLLRHYIGRKVAVAALRVTAKMTPEQMWEELDERQLPGLRRLTEEPNSW